MRAGPRLLSSLYQYRLYGARAPVGQPDSIPSRTHFWDCRHLGKTSARHQQHQYGVGMARLRKRAELFKPYLLENAAKRLFATHFFHVSLGNRGNHGRPPAKSCLGPVNGEVVRPEEFRCLSSIGVCSLEAGFVESWANGQCLQQWWLPAQHTSICPFQEFDTVFFDGIVAHLSQG